MASRVEKRLSQAHCIRVEKNHMPRARAHPVKAGQCSTVDFRYAHILFKGSNVYFLRISHNNLLFHWFAQKNLLKWPPHEKLIAS